MVLSAALLATPLERACAHGVVIGRNAAGQLRALVEVHMPIPLPPSPFPGIPGWADAEPGIASAEIDEPTLDVYQLSADSDVQFELLRADPGIQIVTSHAWAPGETLEFGPPFFDFHLVFDIFDGRIGATYAIEFRLHDLHGIHADSDVVTLLFTPVANVCACRGDLDADMARTGDDIQPVVACLAAAAAGEPLSPACACADMDADGTLDSDDIALLVNRLLRSDGCP